MYMHHRMKPTVARPAFILQTCSAFLSSRGWDLIPYRHKPEVRVVATAIGPCPKQVKAEGAMEPIRGGKYEEGVEVGGEGISTYAANPGQNYDWLAHV